MKVWICSDGSYSDYSVRSVYSTKEAADLISKAYDWNEPEEFELDSAMPDQVRDGYFYYGVTMRADGDTTRVHTTEPSPWDADRWDVVRGFPGGWSGRQLQAHCWARDKEHAIKIVNERRIMSQVMRGMQLLDGKAA